jgi:hypothetical protein
LNKGDGLLLEAHQTLDGLADGETFSSVTVKQKIAIRDKVNGRLTPELCEVYLSSWQPGEAATRGSTLSSNLKKTLEKVTAACPLVRCIQATEGEDFHPDALAKAMDAATAAGVPFTPAVSGIVTVS